MKTASDDKLIYGGNKPINDEVVMEDIVGTVVEELVERTKYEVEVNITLT